MVTIAVAWLAQRYVPGPVCVCGVFAHAAPGCVALRPLLAGLLLLVALLPLFGLGCGGAKSKRGVRGRVRTMA